jgi:hypothetical protein
MWMAFFFYHFSFFFFTFLQLTSYLSIHRPLFENKADRSERMSTKQIKDGKGEDELAERGG